MGNLYLIATPIGNREDITIRALKTIFSLDYLLCEDTRKTGLYLQYLENYKEKLGVSGTKPKLISYFEGNEVYKIQEAIALLLSGHNLGLVSNAGTPTISDPGYKLVRECKKNNITIVSIPGSCALISGLVSSGLPTDKFIFVGFLPKKSGKSQRLLDNLKKGHDLIGGTVIIYESPHRFLKTLEMLKTNFGNINITIARELTKIYEEVKSGTISELIQYYKSSAMKGELVILFSFLDIPTTSNLEYN